MENLKKLKDTICRELEKMSRLDNINASSLDAIDKLTHTLKSIETINAMEQGNYSNEYSRDSYANGNSNGYSRADSYSYARNRDSMGRYSRDGYSRYSREGYSGHSDLKKQLEDILNNSESQDERQMVKQWLQML